MKRRTSAREVAQVQAGGGNLRHDGQSKLAVRKWCGERERDDDVGWGGVLALAYL